MKRPPVYGFDVYDNQYSIEPESFQDDPQDIALLTERYQISEAQMLHLLNGKTLELNEQVSITPRIFDFYRERAPE